MKQPPSQHRRQQREKDNAEEAKHDLLPASAFDTASSSASSSRASHPAPNTSHASSSAQVNPASTRSMRLRNKKTQASGLQK
jgi:hypothetical protein